MDPATDLTKLSFPLGKPQSLAPLPVPYLCNKTVLKLIYHKRFSKLRLLNFMDMNLQNNLL
jgi:hypothetical protein